MTTTTTKPKLSYSSSIHHGRLPAAVVTAIATTLLFFPTSCLAWSISRPNSLTLNLQSIISTATRTKTKTTSVAAVPALFSMPTSTTPLLILPIMARRNNYFAVLKASESECNNECRGISSLSMDDALAEMENNNDNSSSRSSSSNVSDSSSSTHNNYSSLSDDTEDINSSSRNSNNHNISQQILDLAIPALISLSIDPLMTIADTAFVGRYSAPNDPYPLAGLGSSAALLVFAFYIFNFLATATAPLVASRRAANDESGARLVGGQALSLSIVLGTILASFLLTYRAPLLQLMGTSVTGPQAYEYAEQFLIVRGLAAPAVLLCSASNGVMRGYLDTKTPTVILLGSNVINLALDVILVGNMGMGPLGAGIATTVAEWIAALCFLAVLGGKLPSASEEWNSISRRTETTTTLDKQEINNLTVTPVLELPTWTDIRPLIVASSAVFLRSIVLQVAMSSAAAMAARSSTTSSTNDIFIAAVATSTGASASVAAHQVALQLWLLCSFLCDALATASQALVADGIGRKDTNSVREICQIVFSWGLILGLTLSTCLWIGKSSGILLDFFTSDELTRIELGKLLTVVVLAQPLNSFVFAADGVLQGAGEFGYQAKSMALSVICAFSTFAVLEYTAFGQDIVLRGNNDSLVNVWYGLITLQFMRGVTSLAKLVDEKGPINLTGP